MKVISKQEFKALFKGIHTKSSDTRFCFILGAGASFTSGIKTGMQLAEIWYNELKEEVLTKSEFEKWKTDKKIDEKNLGYYYGIIYHRRFENHKQSGYDYLNNIMQYAQPSFGYTVLAQLLSSTRHNVIITTNFDDLTEQALYYYTEKRPLVCGHENLALFAKPSQERPLIIKTHRDLLLNPMSEPEEIGELKTEWTNTLDTIFKNFIPVFIGYGGNDGSLMNYLSKVDKFENLFWMKRKGDAVNSTIEKLLNDKDGKLVEIEGFDEIMYDLLMSTDIKLIGEEIINNAHKRRNKYDEQVIDIRKRIEKSGEESEEDRLDFKAKAENSDLVKAYLEIENEKDIEKKEALYKKAIDTYKEESMFYNNYANFLYEQRKDFDAIEINYKKAIELNPEEGSYYGNYAIFLSRIRKKNDKAEENYKKGIVLNPENGNLYANYAIFLNEIRMDYNTAEINYKKSIEINPVDGDFYYNYALFLYGTKKDFDSSEVNYKKAIELNPNEGRNYEDYAILLQYIRKDYDTAETYYKKAIELNPENGNFYFNYALFLYRIKKEYEKAEKNYKKAIELNPENEIYYTNYAIFLKNITKDFDGAEINYKKAINLNPKNGSNYSNYAVFLKDIRKDYEVAEINYKKAIELDSENGIYNGNYAQLLLEKGDKKNGKIYLDKAFSLCDKDELLSELWFYRYAHFPKTYLEEAAKELDKLIEKGVKTLDWNFEGNIQHAIKDKHPQPEKLKYYADKLSKE